MTHIFRLPGYEIDVLTPVDLTPTGARTAQDRFEMPNELTPLGTLGDEPFFLAIRGDGAVVMTDGVEETHVVCGSREALDLYLVGEGANPFDELVAAIESADTDALNRLMPRFPPRDDGYASDDDRLRTALVHAIHILADAAPEGPERISALERAVSIGGIGALHVARRRLAEAHARGNDWASVWEAGKRYAQSLNRDEDACELALLAGEAALRGAADAAEVLAKFFGSYEPYAPELIEVARERWCERVPIQREVIEQLLPRPIDSGADDLREWWSALPDVWRTALLQHVPAEPSDADLDRLRRVRDITVGTEQRPVSDLEPIGVMEGLRSVTLHAQRANLAPLAELPALCMLRYWGTVRNLEAMKTVRGVEVWHKIERVWDFTTPRDPMVTDLFAAIGRGDVDRVRALVKRGAPLDEPHPKSKMLPVELARRKGDVAMEALLAELGGAVP